MVCDEVHRFVALKNKRCITSESDTINIALANADSFHDMADILI